MLALPVNCDATLCQGLMLESKLAWKYNTGQAGLKLEVVLLPQTRKGWKYRCKPPLPAFISFLYVVLIKRCQWLGF